MNISENLLTLSSNSKTISDKNALIAENEKKVYDAGVGVGKVQANDAFWDEFQDYGKRQNYAYAFAGESWINKIKDLKYPITPVDTYATRRYATGMFMWFNRNSTDPDSFDYSLIANKIDFSKCYQLPNVFACCTMNNVVVDFSGATSLSGTFTRSDGGAGIPNITLKVTENLKTISQTFNNTLTLINLVFTDDSVIATSGLDLHWSTKLSKASILSIFNALSTTTTGESLKISLTAVNNAFETSEGLADGSTSDEWTALIASRSNWTVALSDT